MTTAVAVLGAAGRMGGETCRAIDAADDLELVARIGSADSLDRLVETDAQVAVDLTGPDAVMDNLRFCIEHGIHTVVGTSGSTTSGWQRCADGSTGSRASASSSRPTSPSVRC